MILLHFEEIRKKGMIYKSVSGFGTLNAFSTRFSGVSTLDHLRSLNLAYGRGESDENVDKNYALFFSALGIPQIKRVSGVQTHSANVASVTKDDAGKSFENTDAFKWLSKNAHKFGFILRYPKDKTEITGYDYEPWHYRFVGREAATEIYLSGLCLEEYLGLD